MDPLTHFLTGATLARAGLNRRSRYATLTMVLAAEAPDCDTLWSLKGPVVGFLHHRGWTHTFLGLPVDAAAVLAAVYLWHRWRELSSRPKRNRGPRRGPLAGVESKVEGPASAPAPGRGKPARTPQQPVHWPTLFLLALIALLSHLLLDWTNNYGLRPFAPFNPRWYAGSFVFIVEPVMLLLLAAGLLWPLLSRLVSSEIGARRPRFPSRAPAVAALLGILALYGLRGYERLHAQALALTADYGNVPLLRSTVSPYPINPFRWHAVVETPDFFQTSTVDSLAGTVSTTSQEDLFFKPPETLDTLAAKQTLLGRAYLDWSHWALVTQAPVQPTDDTPPGAATVVTFRDLRYLYDVLGVHGRSEAPLSGTVLLNRDHEVLEQSLDGKVQH